MTLQAAAYWAGFHAALDVAGVMLDADNPDDARSALARARFEGIVTAEAEDHRLRTLDAAGTAVADMLSAVARADGAAMVEKVAQRVVVADLDVAAEALTMLAMLAHRWRTEAQHAQDALEPPVTPRWALGWVSRTAEG